MQQRYSSAYSTNSISWITSHNFTPYNILVTTLDVRNTLNLLSLTKLATHIRAQMLHAIKQRDVYTAQDITFSFTQLPHVFLPQNKPCAPGAVCFNEIHFSQVSFFLPCFNFLYLSHWDEFYLHLQFVTRLTPYRCLPMLL